MATTAVTIDPKRKMSDRKILAAIEGLQQSINSRFDDLESRLTAAEKTQERQGKDIETLFEQVDELCKRRPVWKSKDGREVGVRKEEAYSIFRDLGFTRLEAIRIIDEANKLVRDGDGRHIAKAVRAPGIGKIRAVVILMESSR